ncbi:MAG: hypothetical protein HQK53_02940 [Oligoflexia bacterium]|nr:hypothetical protein [Oligoflexia bacterium]
MRIYRVKALIKRYLFVLNYAICGICVVGAQEDVLPENNKHIKNVKYIKYNEYKKSQQEAKKKHDYIRSIDAFNMTDHTDHNLRRSDARVREQDMERMKKGNSKLAVQKENFHKEIRAGIIDLH